MGSGTSAPETTAQLRDLSEASSAPTSLEDALAEISRLRGGLRQCVSAHRFREQTACSKVLNGVNELPPWATLRQTAEVYRSLCVPELVMSPSPDGTAVFMSEALVDQDKSDSCSMRLVTGDDMSSEESLVDEAVRLSEEALETGLPARGSTASLAVVAVPLFSDEVDGFGATMVLWHAAGPSGSSFDASQITSLDGVLRLTGMFLLRTACSIRAQSELSQEHELLESLLQVAKILFKNNTDLMGTLDAVMEHVHSIISVDRVSIFIKDEKSKELWCRSEKAKFRVPLDTKSFAGLVAETGDALNIADAYEDPRFDPTNDKKSGYRTRTVLCLPIFNERGKTVGVIMAINKKSSMREECGEEGDRGGLRSNRKEGGSSENEAILKI